MARPNQAVPVKRIPLHAEDGETHGVAVNLTEVRVVLRHAGVPPASDEPGETLVKAMFAGRKRAPAADR